MNEERSISEVHSSGAIPEQRGVTTRPGPRGPVPACRPRRVVVPLRGGHPRLRPGRGDRVGHRAPAAVRHPPHVRGPDHRFGHVPDPLSPPGRDPEDGGLHPGPGGDDRGLLPVRDPRLAPGPARDRTRGRPLTLALFINAASLIMAPAVFHRAGLFDVAAIQDAHQLLAPIVGSALAPILLAVALISAGTSSTIPGP